MTHLQIKRDTPSQSHFGFLPSSMHWQAMDDLYERFAHHWPFHKSTESVPTDVDSNIKVNVDINEDKHAYKMSVELPGLDIEHVDLDLSDGVLTLSGDKEFERKEDKKNYHLVERSYGAFKRSFVLPPSVEQEKIEAKFDRGVLSIVLPKSEQAQKKQRKISIDN